MKFSGQMQISKITVQYLRYDAVPYFSWCTYHEIHKNFSYFFQILYSFLFFLITWNVFLTGSVCFLVKEGIAKVIWKKKKKTEIIVTSSGKEFSFKKSKFHCTFLYYSFLYHISSRFRVLNTTIIIFFKILN